MTQDRPAWAQPAHGAGDGHRTRDRKHVVAVVGVELDSLARG
jgi:hypothetical protein